MDMCFHKAPVLVQVPPDPPHFFAALVALAAAVTLALVLWVYLDKEFGLTFMAHEWAYVMLYEENLWQGEIIYVTPEQTAVYEQGGEFGPLLQMQTRNSHYLERPLDGFWFWEQFKISGRKLLFWHEYQWTYWEVYFCGVLTRIAPNRLKLRYPGEDPFQPFGPWWRPGGFWGTPEYEGCWQELWWL
ncbi:hypothetical protein ES703_108334 [subsurface metagenome]